MSTHLNFRKPTTRPAILAFLLILAIAPVFGAHASRLPFQEKRQHSEHDKNKPSVIEEQAGHATLWKDPGAIENLDLTYGAGGPEGPPDPAGRFTLIRRLHTGTAKKMAVKDDKGREWTVKFGPEVRPETAANRIVWAMGYHVDEIYFVKSVHIEGLKGDATNVRFKRTHNGYHEIGLWNWNTNAFKGTRELDGLKVLMALLNNWDLKNDNNSVVRVGKDGEGNAEEKIYYVSDLGASFGETGSLVRKVLFFADPPAGSKNDPSGYARQAFIDGVRNGEVQFHYKGKDADTLKGISVENARWMGSMLGRLSEKQLRVALRSSGFDEVDEATLLHAIQERISTLQNLK